MEKYRENLISIIVPVYNEEKYINECIDSILDQTYENFELILVDDGSKDNSGNICDEYSKIDNRIKVIHKPNGGISSARNIGIEESNGELIAFIDSDDWIEKNFLEELFRVLKEENADIAICGYNRVVGKRLEDINSSGEKKIYNPFEYLIKLLNPQLGLGFSHQKLIKRKVIGDIRFNANLSVAEDSFFNLQLVDKVKKVVHYMIPLYNYRINSRSMVRGFDQEFANKYRFSMEITKEFILDKYNDKIVMQNFYNFVAFHVMLVCVNYCYHPENDYKNGKKYIRNISNMEIFKEGIDKSNYDNLSITRKITLFTIKHKLYTLLKFICKYRNMQNRKG